MKEKSRGWLYVFIIMVAIVCILVSPPTISFAVDCNRPPTGFGGSWARAYASWCQQCGGSYNSSNQSCNPGPNWGGRGGGSTQPTYDYEAERQRQEAERQRQLEAERQRQRELEEERRRQEEEARIRQEDFEIRKQEALRSMKGITEGELGLKGIDSGALGLKDIGDSGTGGLGLKDIGDKNTGSLGIKDITNSAKSPSSSVVRKEQDEFDNMNAAWLRKQQDLIRQAVEQDKKWKNEVLASIKRIKVPSPVFRPKTFDDLHLGDILLIAPDDSLKAKAISVADPLYRAIDYFSAGDVSAPDLEKEQASHAITFVRTVNGEMLFLDHTSDGSRILNKEDYIRQYGGRAAYIARPQTKADGRVLWEEARNAALQKKSDYGFFGKNNVVCSERAAIAVAKATGLTVSKEGHRMGKFLGPVDITPNDFFDDKHVGKYFLISASPILPSKE